METDSTEITVHWWLEAPSSLSPSERAEREAVTALFRSVPDALQGLFGGQSRIRHFAVSPHVQDGVNGGWLSQLRCVRIKAAYTEELGRLLTRADQSLEDRSRAWDALHILLHEGIHSLSPTFDGSQDARHAMSEGFTELAAQHFNDEFVAALVAPPGIRLSALDHDCTGIYIPHVTACRLVLAAACSITGRPFDQELQRLARDGLSTGSSGIANLAASLVDTTGISEFALARRDSAERAVVDTLESSFRGLFTDRDDMLAEQREQREQDEGRGAQQWLDEIDALDVALGTRVGESAVGKLRLLLDRLTNEERARHQLPAPRAAKPSRWRRLVGSNR